METSILIDWFAGLPPQLATALIAMLPITELRASIPVALLIYELPVWQSMLFSIIGDIIPTLLILFFLGPFGVWCSKKSKKCNRFFDWAFTRTRRKFSHKYDVYGALALMLFVAIPLPFTGAWSGSLAAWLFDIPKRLAVPYIVAGIIVAAVIVTALTIGINGAIGWIF